MPITRFFPTIDNVTSMTIGHNAQGDFVLSIIKGEYEDVLTASFTRDQIQLLVENINHFLLKEKSMPYGDETKKTDFEYLNDRIAKLETLHHSLDKEVANTIVPNLAELDDRLNNIEERLDEIDSGDNLSEIEPTGSVRVIRLDPDATDAEWDRIQDLFDHWDGVSILNIVTKYDFMIETYVFKGVSNEQR